MASTNVIGDSQVTAVQPLIVEEPLPITTEAKLLDKDDPINLKLYSGKKAGALYAYSPGTDEMEVVIATGPEPTDPWIRLGGLIDATALKADWATSDIAADAKADWAAGDVGDAAAIAVALNAQAVETNLILDGVAANMNTVAAEVNAFITASTITPV